MALSVVSGGLGGALLAILKPSSLQHRPPIQAAQLQAFYPSPKALPLQPLAAPVQQIERQEIHTVQQQLAQSEIQRLTYTAPKSLQSQVIYEGQVNAKDPIALTIDDGPWGTTTDQMLDILKAYHVKATFFWVGQAIESFPETARRVLNEGHALGNHSWHHRYAPMSAVEAASEIEITAKIIREVTGARTTLFRPPGGYLNNGMADYAMSQGYTIVMWSITSADTDASSDVQAYVNNVLSGAKPGGIILIHDGGGDRSKTVKALPLILEGLKQRGYRFVTIPELLRMQDEGM